MWTSRFPRPTVRMNRHHSRALHTRLPRPPDAHPELTRSTSPPPCTPSPHCLAAVADFAAWLLYFPKVIGPQRRVLLIRIATYLGMLHEPLGESPTLRAWTVTPQPLGLALGPGRYLQKLFPLHLKSEVAVGQFVMACCPLLGAAVVKELEVMLAAERGDRDAYEHANALWHYEGLVRLKYDPAVRGNLCFSEAEHPFCEILQEESGYKAEHVSRIYPAPDRQRCPIFVGCKQRCMLLEVNLQQAKGRDVHTLLSGVAGIIAQFAEAVAEGVPRSALDGATSALLDAIRRPPSPRPGAVRAAMALGHLPVGLCSIGRGDAPPAVTSTQLGMVWATFLRPLARGEVLDLAARCAMMALRLAVTLVMVLKCCGDGAARKRLRAMGRALASPSAALAVRTVLVALSRSAPDTASLVVLIVLELVAIVATKRAGRRAPMLIVLMRLAYLSQRATTEFPSQEQIRVELKHMAAQWMVLRILLFYLEQALVRALLAPLPPAPCNGTYAFSREHEGRPLYKKEGGAAIIYFKKDWPALRRIFTDEISMATSTFVL